ncbi:histidine kinase [Vibrio cholerae]|uniref:histidine kinase n=1 Tax=Vibrio cholerae TaxID=666 RepID=UPI001FA7A2CF|nr:histidine kinase [Vibrio cholerae]MCI4612934.1 histidine kinase [Vibrio cholerae]MDV2359849.1 histidine kinase [Vibrio cholerae]MDV2367999.1 histidine kinase [Vibrio cholerae]MDV2407824.1 histidine kinase [Vibrio cholerae]
MLIYKSILSTDKSITSENISKINKKLNNPNIIEYMIKSGLNDEHGNLLVFFQEKIENQTYETIRSNSNEFVKIIDNLIYEVERNTERNIESLENIQKVFSIMMIIFGIYAIGNLYSRLFKPWMSILDISRSIKSGDFSKKFIVQKYKDEMNELGNSINLMSESLKETYIHLENIVYCKTEDLNRKNKYLDFLYRACKRFNNEQYSCDMLAPLVQELIELTDIHKVTILINDYQESDNTQIFDFGSLSRPDFCKNLSCNLCFDNEKRSIENVSEVTIKLKDSSHDYGKIVISNNTKSCLNIENEQLIIAFSELLTQSLSVFYKVQQDQQLLILKERNTIARELHDSIAQSLSCLKIKLSILQMDLSNLNKEQILIIGEMREEVNVAYSQLRELLTTFRLKLDGLGFLPALESTVKEYNKKIGTKINFRYEIPANKISAHHSIHLIQIIRELLNNIYKHAQASSVTLYLSMKDNDISLVVLDDGCGFSTSQENSRYGLKIIGDRAQTLSGKWDIISSPGNGTEFHLTFPIYSRV